MNVTDSLIFFAEGRIKVVKEEAGTIAFNQAYDKIQADKDKSQTRQLLEFSRRKVHGQINQWQIIMIISTAIQNIPDKVWKYFFVAVNLHPYHHLSFSSWTKKIAPTVKTGDTEYFQKREGSYYDAMLSIWKNKTMIKSER